MDSTTIRVDIEDLIDKLKEMLDDEYVTVELTINTSDYYDDSTLRLKAIDISEDGNIDYGELAAISEELF